jgi:predicted CopG family antitoxin
MPWIKRWGNKAFSRVISKIIRKKITDCQTGFRAFTRKVAESVEIVSDHTYTQEQVIKTVRTGFRVCEVPVNFGVRRGKSRLIKNPFEYAVKAWINLFRIYRDYEPLKFFGIFGMLMLIPAFLIGGYFVFLHLTQGIKGHLGLLFLMMLLFMSGIQVIFFGFLADMKRR